MFFDQLLQPLLVLAPPHGTVAALEAFVPAVAHFAISARQLSGHIFPIQVFLVPPIEEHPVLLLRPHLDAGPIAGLQKV